MKVVIEASTTPNGVWKLTGAVKLRIYASRSFWNSDGQLVPQGTPGSGHTSYLEITCVVADGTLVIPSFEIDSTVDALDDIWVTYTAELVAGSRRIPFLQNFPVNTLVAGDPSYTWQEIILHKNLIAPQTIPESLSRQIAALITVAVGQLNKSSETNFGNTALSANPVDPAFPIAISQTDPLWQSLSAGTGLVSGSDTATMVDGTVTIPSVEVTTDSKILVTSNDDGVFGSLRVSAIVPGVSFTITSSNGGDNGIVAWIMFGG